MEPVADPAPWNTWIAELPGAHLLQTAEWGRLKARFGWRPEHWVWRAGPSHAVAAAALTLLRQIRLPGAPRALRVAYVPRGPLLDWTDAGLRHRVLTDLQEWAAEAGAIFVKIDPDVRVGTGVPGTKAAVPDPSGLSVLEHLGEKGWQFSQEQIQFRNTVLLDLTPPEEELLAQMKQKTRYNIRLAARRGVRIRPAGAADFGLLYEMYAETARRDGFAIRDPAYYREAWGSFLAGDKGSALQPTAEPLLAEVEGTPVAALVPYRFGSRAWYLFGMSRLLHRQLMPNHLLQWEAIRWARAAGCRTYDLWGAPDVFTEADSLWGVYRFKRGFGGQVTRHLGAWDYPVRPLLYRVYGQVMPHVLELLRMRGRALRAGAVQSAAGEF